MGVEQPWVPLLARLLCIVSCSACCRGCIVVWFAVIIGKRIHQGGVYTVLGAGVFSARADALSVGLPLWALASFTVLRLQSGCVLRAQYPYARNSGYVPGSFQCHCCFGFGVQVARAMLRRHRMARCMLVGVLMKHIVKHCTVKSTEGHRCRWMCL